MVVGRESDDDCFSDECVCEGQNNNTKRDFRYTEAQLKQLQADDDVDKETPSSPPILNESQKDNTSRFSALKRYLLLIVFLALFPLAPMTIAVPLGGLMAALHNVTFQDGFYYVISNLLRMNDPLTDFSPERSVGVVDVYISVMGLLLLGITLNVINAFQMPRDINRIIRALGIRSETWVSLIACLVLIPAFIALVAVGLGVLLAGFEGWSNKHGVEYVFSNLMGLGTPLTDAQPDSFDGNMLAIIISSTGLACAAIFLDYVMVLNPAQTFRTSTIRFMERHNLLLQQSGTDDDYNFTTYQLTSLQPNGNMIREGSSNHSSRATARVSNRTGLRPTPSNGNQSPTRAPSTQLRSTSPASLTAPPLPSRFNATDPYLPRGQSRQSSSRDLHPPPSTTTTSPYPGAPNDYQPPQAPVAHDDGNNHRSNPSPQEQERPLLDSNWYAPPQTTSNIDMELNHRLKAQGSTR